MAQKLYDIEKELSELKPEYYWSEQCELLWDLEGSVQDAIEYLKQFDSDMYRIEVDSDYYEDCSCYRLILKIKKLESEKDFEARKKAHKNKLEWLNKEIERDKEAKKNKELQEKALYEKLKKKYDKKG